ncbi:MAG: energy-coupling factor transporter transmembrane protein EcfT [Aurantimonas endophytica]|uniref:Biotin transport system permease protein n=1 Tax=Aurantimonas endophytica TaxID=1522175 RepID=A0A7W6HFY8_9HYPH|nr:energy-coupling factor transporter transmembrane protein EcfT [Aurantimonas endophytica]MBB4004321.1 biotin transport system permease protein [Aurantimonas endophytica]MCO6405161.1 energy-coupling factor transporter transmembrane protein EcfT [Aurantimonas endophytica]
MIAGLYRPGTSPVHRARAGTKLALLLGLGTLLFAVDDVALAAAALAITLAAFALARIPARVAFAQIRPALWILGILFAVQLWLVGLEPALLLVLRFAALILAASLVTLTTRTAELVAVIEWALGPLGRVGVDVTKVSLALSLAIRFIPAVSAIADEVREAQRARGQDRNIVALAVPVIVRLLKMADEIAEAIDARS